MKPGSLWSICSVIVCHGITSALVWGAQNQAKPDAAAKPVAEEVKCPVTGAPANLAISAPTKDGPVFFCRKQCVTEFRANQEKYAPGVAAQRAALANRPKVQVKCPVSGDPADPKITTGGERQKVAFCSEDCRKKYAADPSRYASALANSYTFQTKCPVMKELINPASFIKLPSGETVYFCCKGCDEKLMADPAKYAPVLLEQGFTFDFSKPK
jgi:YHS domain-containing protein